MSGENFFEFLSKLVNLWKNEILGEKLQQMNLELVDRAHEILLRVDEELSATSDNVQKEILTQIINIIDYILTDLMTERLSKLVMVVLYGEEKSMEILPSEREFAVSYTHLTLPTTERV